MATKKPAAKKTVEEVGAGIRDAIADTEKAPKPRYAPEDNSIDARMWRLLQDHKAMGSR